MFAEFQFEDIIFGIFPQVGSGISYAYGCWAKNSVGDIIEMLLQMLEVSFTLHVLPLFPKVQKLKALVFIHDLNIAHRVSTTTLSLGQLIFYLNFLNSSALFLGCVP